MGIIENLVRTEVVQVVISYYNNIHFTFNKIIFTPFSGLRRHAVYEVESFFIDNGRFLFDV